MGVSVGMGMALGVLRDGCGPRVGVALSVVKALVCLCCGPGSVALGMAIDVIGLGSGRDYGLVRRRGSGHDDRCDWFRE